MNSASMVMVGVGTFIAGRYIFRDSFTNAGWWWGKLKHYLLVVGLVVLLFVLPMLLRIGIGKIELANLDRTKIVWFFVLPLVGLIPAFGEEFGWRGYMLPHIAHRLTVRKAVALHALIWYIWHLPLLIGDWIQAGIEGAAETNIPAALSVIVTVVAGVILAAVPVIMHGVVFAYIWVQSRSLAVVTFYHALYNGVRDSIDMVVGLPPMGGIWNGALLTILGAFFLWKGNWKRLDEKSSSN